VRRQVGGHLHHVVEVVEGGHIRISLVNTCHYKQFVWDPPCGGYIFVPTQLVFLVGRLHIVDDVGTLQGGDSWEDLILLRDTLHVGGGVDRLGFFVSWVVGVLFFIYSNILTIGDTA